MSGESVTNGGRAQGRGARGKGRGIVLVVALLLIAAAVAYLVRERSASPATTDKSSAIAVVENRNLDVVAEAAGLVEPIRVVDVKSRASGEVLAVHVESGDRVEKGALLVEIDPRDVQNALAQATADLESARVQRDTAEAHKQRMEELRKSGAATQQEYEGSIQAAAAARANVVRAETNLLLARERRNDVTIRAPAAGTVLQRSAQPGQIIASATSNVSGGTTLFTMADLSTIQVRAKVDEMDVGQVAPEQTALVSVEAYPGRTFLGKVFKIEPQAVVEQNVTLFPVLVRLENPAGLLRPGMNADVKIRIASRSDAVVVPNSAVVNFRGARAAARLLGLDENALRDVMKGQGGADWSDGGSREDGQRPAIVFVQAAGGPQPRRVTVGLSDWEYSEVVDGLEPGEKVLLLSVARIQREQRDRMEQIRQRTGGGVVPGSGGGQRRSGGGG